MVTSHRDFQYSVLSEPELDLMLSGAAPDPNMLATQPAFRFLDARMTGVVWVPSSKLGQPVQPLVLVCREEDQQRLCGRYAQLRNDLSPLSAWCHLVTPAFFESIDSMWRDPDLGGAEAAWTGVAVAEAILATERPLAKIRLQTCLATQTFAIARSRALWLQLETLAVLKRFDQINRLCRNASGRQERLRASLIPIWDCLAGLSSEQRSSTLGLLPVIDAMRALRDARHEGRRDEARALAHALRLVVPEAQQFASLDELPAEIRLRLFDRLVQTMEHTGRDDAASQLRRHSLAFLAGYLSTVAAGGAPSLSLIQNSVDRNPELLAWAYLAGSIGERVVWAAGFDGLGRLIGRELMRPMRLDESPSCDFALDEAKAVVDNQLSDPLVRLRVKQSAFANVSLFPGVNISVPIDAAMPEAQRQEARNATVNTMVERTPSVAPTSDRMLATFFDALRPLLQREVRKILRETEDERDRSGRNRNKKKTSADTQLPLHKK